MLFIFKFLTDNKCVWFYDQMHIIIYNNTAETI